MRWNHLWATILHSLSGQVLILACAAFITGQITLFYMVNGTWKVLSKIIWHISNLMLLWPHSFNPNIVYIFWNFYTLKLPSTNQHFLSNTQFLPHGFIWEIINKSTICSRSWYFKYKSNLSGLYCFKEKRFQWPSYEVILWLSFVKNWEEYLVSSSCVVQLTVDKNSDLYLLYIFKEFLLQCQQWYNNFKLFINIKFNYGININSTGVCCKRLIMTERGPASNTRSQLIGFSF